MKNKIKKCTKCGKDYPPSLEYFCARIDSKDRLRNDCKKCYNKYLRKYYKAHKEAMLQANKNWRDNNKEKIKSINKNYHKKHIKEERQYRKKYYLEHKKEENNRVKKYRFKHKEKNKKYNQEYYKNNKIKYQKYSAKYHQKHRKERLRYCQKYGYKHKKERNKYLKSRRETDIEYKIISNLRNRLCFAIKCGNAKKSNHTLELMGCSVQDLMKYLELKFLPRMSWNNYGKGDDKWNIDHIIPIVAFDMKKEEEQKKCFHYTNLQPLWQPDNCKKLSFHNGKLIKRRVSAWRV